MTEKEAKDIMSRDFSLWVKFVDFLRVQNDGHNTSEEIEFTRIMFVESAIESGTIEA